MDSDDDFEFSIHDLEHAPGIVEHPSIVQQRRNSISEHTSGLGPEIIHDGDLGELGRARVWSSGGGNATLSELALSPRAERRNLPMENLRNSLSMRLQLGENVPQQRTNRNLLDSGSSDDDDSTSYVIDSSPLSHPPTFQRGQSTASVNFPRLSFSRSFKENDSAGSNDAMTVRANSRGRHYSDPTKYSPRGLARKASSEGQSEDSYDDDEFPNQNANQERDDSITTAARPFILCGIQLPACCWRKQPSWNRVAACVVTNAPCFCCFRFGQRTDRAILQRLNILCAFFAFVQIVASLWLFIVLYGGGRADNETEGDERIIFANLWNVNGAVFMLGLLSFVLLATTLLTVPVIRSVNLLGAIRYLWVVLWIWPFQLFFIIGLFDYFRVTKVWIRHHWRDESLSVFRRTFCEPSETYNTLCAVPMVEDIDGWCAENYNSTACSEIQSSAQADLEKAMTSFYYSVGTWAILLILLLVLVVHTLESIISRPLVQKSRESNVPIWFSLPTIGCFLGGVLFSFSTSSIFNRQTEAVAAAWIGPLYMATGGFFFLAAILGWFLSSYSILNTRDKRYKLIAITLFIMAVVIIFLMLVSIFAGSIAYSVSLVEVPLSNSARGEVACFIDQNMTCTGCEDDEILPRDKCPEWTVGEVTNVLQSQAKSSAAFAAIFLLYALSALRFGFAMRRYIILYQIDYV